MKENSLFDWNLKTKISGIILLSLSLAALGLVLLQLSTFSIQQFGVLGFALLISIIINQHQIRIPKTPAYFSAKEATAFWGIIWLGVPGGVLLAVSASAVRFLISKKNKSRWLFDILINGLSTFAAGQVFYLILQRFGEYHQKFVAEEFVSPLWLTAAVGGAALTHYALTSLSGAILLKIEDIYSFSEIRKRYFSQKSINYLLAVVAVFLFHYVFLEFGLAFGWVVLPVAVISHLAYRIHLKRLAQKTKEIVEASRIHLATVEALATAIDARDQVGIGHVRRTQIYAVGIGEILGLPEEELDALNTGALLHDIGKLAVPDHILNKPGRLTPAEMEKTKIHSSVGASILEKINFSSPVVPTVKYHHESWDGSGYPEGLKGNEIPLTARILLVADAYDTLRGARPYRAAVSRDEARRFLINGAGTQFDPRIVDVFLRNLKKFENLIGAEGLSYKNDGQTETESSIHHSDNDSKSYVEQIKRANREVFTLYELARIFGSALNLPETLSLFVEKIRELAPFDTCAIYLLEKDGTQAKAVYTEGKNSEALLNRSVKAGEGATGYVLKKRQSVHNINPGLDFSFCQLEFVQEYLSMASLPLIANEKLLGAISLYSCTLENYEDEHMRLLETISRIASDAISKSLYHAETETKALTDPMTALPNARSLQIHFEKEAGRAARNRTSFQVLMLDLDGFKEVNDTFGHKIGDRVLKELARVMREQLREYDFLARYAGDEFVAIIPETEDRSVPELCQRIENAVCEFTLPVGDGRFAQVGVSIGAASFPNNGESLDQIIIAADKTMYHVKARHRHEKQQQANLQKAVSGEDIEVLPEPIPIRSTEQTVLQIEEVTIENSEENFVVELDESHVISSAIN